MTAVNGPHFGPLQNCLRITLIPSAFPPRQNNTFLIAQTMGIQSYIQAIWIHPYIEKTMWIHRFTKKPTVQAMWINFYIEATMRIHQHTEVPDAWKMWIYSYIVMAVWIHQHIRKPGIQAMRIDAYITMFPHFEGIPHK